MAGLIGQRVRDDDAFGGWDSDVSLNPSDVADILARHNS